MASLLIIDENEHHAFRGAKRKLNGLAQAIHGIAESGRSALEDVTRRELFKVRFDRAQAKWEQFESQWSDLEGMYIKAKEDDKFPTDADLATHTSICDEILEAQVSLNRLQHNTKLDRPEDISFRLNTSASEQFRSSHLPRVTIPVFDGDLLRWNNFRDTYVSLVHQDNRISNIEKFNYLRSALKGEACAHITKLPVTSETYELAWKTITQAYDNPRVLASHYIRRVLEHTNTHTKPSLESYQHYLVGVLDNIEAFKQLKVANASDFLLSLLALRSLEPETRRDFELMHLKTEFPRTDDLFTFIQNRIRAYRLSAEDAKGKPNFERGITPTPPQTRRGGRYPPYRGAKKYSSTSFHTVNAAKPQNIVTPPSSSNKRNTNGKYACPMTKCKAFHSLGFCEEFSGLTLEQRIQFVKAWKGCGNCLFGGHQMRDCKSRHTCRHCGERHHTLLHQEVRPAVNAPDSNSGNRVNYFTSRQTSALRRQVILGTARVMIRSSDGRVVAARALLDSCSEYTLISRRLTRKLKCKILPCDESLKGIGEVPLGTPTGTVSFCIVGGDTQLPVDAAVVDAISAASPSFSVPLDILEEMSDLDLADDTFGQPLPVDVLIGADIYAALLTGKPIQTKFSELYLLPTVFGLVVTGKTNKPGCPLASIMSTFSLKELDCSLKRFWETEEPQVIRQEDPQNVFCESHFINTHHRTDSGRYVVKLPVSPEIPNCGYNRDIAQRRFYNLEKRLHGDDELRHAYVNFMKEYLSLGHMTPATSEADYIIPHHGIWKGVPPNRKLRVVFDASCPSTSRNGSKSYSLNETLLSGPKLQLDISNILTRFRMFAVAITCDLVKMYRQILVHPSQRGLQHIFWRDNPSLPLLEFELNTLTYGETPCAFLAIRTLHQLAKDEASDFPLASGHVREAMYVDDLVSGTDTEEEALQLKDELIGIFARAGFELDKWSSNLTSLLPTNQSSNDSLIFSDKENDYTKILGLVWSPRSDTFSYSIGQPEDRATKRSILSSIARVFDPLGLLTPVIFTAKALMQDLWKEKLGWDDPLPSHLHEHWINISKNWGSLSEVSFPRIATWPDASRCVVGFCDASQRGYAAAVYLRSQRPSGEVSSHLLKAKSKVAPTKFTTIARLELCGASLLARLLSSIHVPGCETSEACCFTDSQVVLSWLNTPTYKLKTYEANRVTTILDVTRLSNWNHVRSEENPADIASRGCLPHQLHSHDLWKNGPHWLTLPVTEWSVSSCDDSALTQHNPVHSLSIRKQIQGSSTYLFEWMSNISSLTRLVRTVVVMLRILRVLDPTTGPIDASEYARGLSKCVYITQRATFPQKMFDEENPVHLRELTPYLDQEGVFRVGGRLKSAPVSINQRHPMIVPKDTHLSKLIVDDVHVRNYHAGPSLTLALIRNNFWIPGGLRFVKGRISRCIFCRKLNPKPLQPLMGNLPLERFSQFRAFLNAGVDFAGPFLIRESNRRKSVRTPEFRQKAYLCLFICLASRALHLECVTSLTSTAFLAALDRFTARRGTPNIIMSDNGTNFVGASRYLKDLYLFLQSQDNIIREHVALKGIEWKFIPPRSPAFGGSWEAGVKSVKTLLTSAVGSQPFTYEELATVFTKIEGLLNSRPLCPLSEDPDEWDVLTPGHFLIGAPLRPIPDDIHPDASSHRSRWDLVKRQINFVWNRWRQEYLHQLMQRRKWKTVTRNLKIGDLVILLQESNADHRWPLARVVEVIHGSDAMVRVVCVRTSNGSVFQRSVATLAPLFPHESETPLTC